MLFFLIIYFFALSHSDLREPAASVPAGATPRGPAEAAGPSTEAACRAGGAAAEDERAAAGQRGETTGTGEHEEGEENKTTHTLNVPSGSRSVPFL